MTRTECVDGMQRIIDEDRNKILVRVHVGYLIHAVKYLKDQPEVVRCKDCGNRECDGRAGTVVCGITGEAHSRLWFCADGERRTDDA